MVSTAMWLYCEIFDVRSLPAIDKMCHLCGVLDILVVNQRNEKKKSEKNNNERLRNKTRKRKIINQMTIVEIVFYFLTILVYICEFHESGSKNCVVS